ncbi:hypothetical protein B0H13DRAFT_2008536, partial [Mycena leptocephala]
LASSATSSLLGRARSASLPRARARRATTPPSSCLRVARRSHRAVSGTPPAVPLRVYLIHAARREVLTETKVEYICPTGAQQDSGSSLALRRVCAARVLAGAVPPATCRRPPLFSPFPAPTLRIKTWKQAAALSGRPYVHSPPKREEEKYGRGRDRSGPCGTRGYAGARCSDDWVRDGLGLGARGGHAAEGAAREGARASDSDVVDI